MCRLIRVASAATALWLVACSPSPAFESGDASRVGGGSGSAAITYQPHVRILDRAEAMAELSATSSDGWTLVFESQSPQLQSLKPGDVLLVKGLLARKVLAVSIQGSQVAALTEPATLGDVIRDGRIELQTPIRFTQPAAAWPSLMTRPLSLAALVVPTVHTQSPESECMRQAETKRSQDDSKKIVANAVRGLFEGWDTEFSAQPASGRLNISITLKKSVGGFVALITGEGYLADFDLSSQIEVEQGIVERLELAHKKLNGVMNFTWEVAKDTPGAHSGNDRIKLPGAISIPLYQYLEGFPLFLEISAAMIIQPAISGGKQYSHGSFRVTYDGYQSFQAKEGVIDADGNVTGNIELVKSQNISALAPMGIVVAFAAPRLELTFGVSKILKFDDIKQAAAKADAIAEQLIRRTFGNEASIRFKSSPMGGFSMSKAAETALKSDAVGFIELVTSSGMSHTGASAIVPCTRTDLHMIVKVGASAQAFGQKIAASDKEIFKRHVERVDPPGARLCDSAA
jgi:hypothetical protein